MSNPEYLIKFRRYLAGCCDAWIETADDFGCNRKQAIETILDSNYEVACVLEVTCEDFKYSALDVTEEIMNSVRAEETKSLIDKYDTERPNITFGEYLWAHTKFPQSGARV